MSKKLFTKQQQSQLKLNPYVKAVSDKSITYTDEFKQFFIDEFEKGKYPREIFLEAGFDIDIIGMTRVNKA
ncbi:IS3 family transposase, partial [Lysinibacillus sp. CNPSo 3705]|uniref:HTH domain-containing protein n=1 Tax=Lysinibacillus sp. CNPSo 3705 TaxID=3028148 RepID=UPI0030823085|nr:IS3 family transposase [Lysinibacillus sp. CNPSo 3705]